MILGLPCLVSRRAGNLAEWVRVCGSSMSSWGTARSDIFWEFGYFLGIRIWGMRGNLQNWDTPPSPFVQIDLGDSVMRNSIMFMLCGCSILAWCSVEKVGAVTPEPASSNSLEIRKYEFAHCLSMSLEEDKTIIQDEQALKSRFQRSPNCTMNKASVDFQRWTLIGRRFTIQGGCSMGRNSFMISVTQDTHRRVYLHTVTTGRGSAPCAGSANLKNWVLVPKLPVGYQVEFRQLKLSNAIIDCADSPDSWDQ